MKRMVFLLLAGLLVLTAAHAQDYTTEDNGSIAVGETVTGELEEGVRDRYTVEVDDTPALNIFLDGDGIDTY
ncbi:MAG TPA: hypothetical protein VK003_20360, partial [Oceanobacillus sp.]|nr:hypothetical protein [Oceanobacillus sp.]